MRKWLKESEEESSWATRKKQIEQRPPLSVRSSRSEQIACRDPKSKSPPPCGSQSSDGTWNHTAAAALRYRSYAYHSPTLLQHAPSGNKAFVIREAAER
ncbi:hypothetical protein QYF36_017387 [Acer negundo]|nr:hypothetical protein QYF36_017387 [Acer negundo]